KYLIVENDDVVVFDGTATGQNVETAAVTSIDVSAGDANDVVDMSAVTTVNGFAGLAGFIVVDGGIGNDSLVGSAFADSILGGSGAESLVGGLGNDTLVGGDGNDLYAFAGTGLGTDRIVEAASAGIDHLDFHLFGSSISVNLGNTS